MSQRRRTPVHGRVALPSALKGRRSLESKMRKGIEPVVGEGFSSAFPFHSGLFLLIPFSFRPSAPSPASIDQHRLGTIVASLVPSHLFSLPSILSPSILPSPPFFFSFFFLLRSSSTSFPLDALTFQRSFCPLCPSLLSFLLFFCLKVIFITLFFLMFISFS